LHDNTIYEKGITTVTNLTKADKSVLRGASEALAHTRGEKLGRANFVITADIDVKAIRKKTGLTQERFAETYGFSLSTLKNWESNRREPEGSAKAYLLVINERPNLVRKALTSAIAA
jgi:putative transcriptional regulator